MTAGRSPDRSALIDKLRSAHRNRLGAPSPSRRSPHKGADKPKSFDFSELPAAREIALHRAAAETFGLNSPFFRVHFGPPQPEIMIGDNVRSNFASYNYLGLNGHTEVSTAAKDAIDRYGISATASRLVGGERPCHRSLEQALAASCGTEDAVVMVSGHATNVTTIGTLLGREDLILMDQLSHNSIAEGARLSQATRLSFPHNDYDWLDEQIGKARARHRHVLIAVEGLYSMDGDTPDLARLVEIKDRHDAWLMVDEAHAVGVLGNAGRGLAEAQSIDPRRIEIWMARYRRHSHLVVATSPEAGHWSRS